MPPGPVYATGAGSPFAAPPEAASGRGSLGEPGGLEPAVSGQLPRRPRPEQPATLEDDSKVAELAAALEQVRGHQDGGAAIPQPHEQLIHEPEAGRVELA